MWVIKPINLIPWNNSRPLWLCSKFLHKWGSYFDYAPLVFWTKSPFCCLQKQKKGKISRASVNCFKPICIMPSDGVSVLSWISSRRCCMSYQRKEKRTSVERNGLSKERMELLCKDTMIVLQICSRWGNCEREEIRGKRESLNQWWHC